MQRNVTNTHLFAVVRLESFDLTADTRNTRRMKKSLKKLTNRFRRHTEEAAEIAEALADSEATVVSVWSEEVSK